MQTLAGSWRGLELFTVLLIILAFGYFGCSSENSETNDPGDFPADEEIAEEEDAAVPADNDPDVSPADSDERENVEEDMGEEVEPEEEETEIEEESPPIIFLEMSLDALDFGEHLANEPKSMASFMIANTGQVAVAVHLPDMQGEVLEVGGFEDQTELAAGENLQVAVSWLPSQGSVDTKVSFAWSVDGVDQAPLQLHVTGTAVDPERSFAGIVVGLFPNAEGSDTVQSPMKGAVVSLEGVAETKTTDAQGRFVFSSLPTGRSEALVTVRAEDSVFGAFSTFRQKVDLEHRKTLRIVLQQYAEELMPVVEGVASYPVGGWEGASFELDSASLAESTTRRDDVTEIGAAVFDPSALPSDFNGTGVPLAVMYVRPFHVTLDPPLSITIPNDWNLPGSSRIAIWMLDDAEDATPSWNKLGYLVLDPAAAYWSTSEGTAISSTGVLAFTLENAETYTVSGQVLDAEGSAIEGAHVDLIAPYSHSTLTDATGAYRFTFQAGEGVPVHIAAYVENVMDGSYTSDSVVLDEPLTPSFPDLYLTDGETGTVAGLVRYDDGSLCPLCLVTATSAYGLQVMDIADENGLFRFDNIPAGDVRVTAHDMATGVTENFDGVLPANEFLIVSLIVESGDTMPPKIVATYPGAGQTGVRAETTLRAAFSEAMNTSGFNLGTATLERLSNADGAPSLVGGSVSAEGERTLVFVPDAPLEIGFYYRFTITTNVEDIAGNPLQEAKIVKFRTVAPNDCVDHPAWPCLIQYFDWETGACRTGFSNGDCSDGNACTVADTCQEGVCVPGPFMVCNALDTCHDVGICDPGTGECSNPAKPDYSSCDDDVFCTIGETCIAGVCTNAEARDCREEVEFDEPRCQIAVCDEFLNTCVIEPVNEGLVCNDGDLCTRSDTCEAGACVGSSPVICEASGPCHETGACDPETGLCSDPLTENGTACDDGNPETGGDSCQGGLCLGTDCTCTGINACCDGCLPIANSDETACNDDDACTENDICNAGACHGEPVVCNPEDTCHFEGICDPSTGECSSRPKPFGTLCDDSNLCTYNDICTQDGCQGTVVECEAIGQCYLGGVCDPETGECTTPAKPDNSPCHDGDFCTLLDVCVEGQCVGGDSVVCTALDACHDAGVCDTETGRCSNPIKADETPCNDGNLCTQTDICVEGICRGNDPVTCLPSDQCHNAGQCDLETGVCSNPAKPDGVQCQDDSHCTENDACLAGVCESGPAVVCEALDDCHVAGVCDEEIGGCSNPTAENGTACDDGNSETEGDACVGGICLGGGCSCTGVNTCCDGCHPVADSDGLACQDGDACTESDVCSEGVCVGESIDCDDDNLCTDNWCDSVLGCLEEYRNGVVCEDGDGCTIGDVCFEGVCKSGEPYECEENAHCENGACYCDEGFVRNPDTNRCVDPCDPNPCLEEHRTVCTVTQEGEVKCFCDPAYTGESCDLCVSDANLCDGECLFPDLEACTDLVAFQESMQIDPPLDNPLTVTFMETDLGMLTLCESGCDVSFEMLSHESEVSGETWLQQTLVFAPFEHVLVAGNCTVTMGTTTPTTAEVWYSSDWYPSPRIIVYDPSLSFGIWKNPVVEGEEIECQMLSMEGIQGLIHSLYDDLLKGTIKEELEATSERFNCRTCFNSCSPDPCHGHGYCDETDGSCTCNNPYMAADCSACIEGHYDYPNCYGEGQNGETCQEDGDCHSDHCQNGFCCLSGDCCAAPEDCPVETYTEAPVCDDPVGCQGHRIDALCGDQICAASETILDDSACGNDIEANDCGNYLSVYCNGESEQVAPVCPTSCLYDYECDPSAYCNPDTSICKLRVSVIDVHPSSLDFGHIPFGIDEPVQADFRISNVGNASLRIQDFSFGENCQNFGISTLDTVSLPIDLSPSEEIEITIEYMPSTVDEMHPFNEECTLTMVSDNAETPEWPIQMHATPIASYLEMRLDGVLLDPGSASIHWGEIWLDSSSDSEKTLVVKNLGRFVLQFSDLHFSGNTSQDFSFSPDLLPDISTGEEKEIRLNYWPQTLGADSGTLIFETNDAREAYRTVEIQLAGLAIEPPALWVTPNGTTANPVDLGDVLQHACSDPRNIRVTNLGTSELEVVAVRVLNHSGGVASNWEIHSIDPELPVFLSSDPEDELAFHVTFCPNGWMTRQDMILGICSNDPDDVRVRPGSDDPDEPDACPEGYGWREIYFRGDGMACATGWHDLDDNPADCEYQCTETLNRVEYCDGQDNDCNGVVDDGYTVGIRYCNDQGADPNNCCDPNLPGDPHCCDGEGVCGVGVWECDPISKLGMICSSDIDGSEYLDWYTPEFCDGLDNDCDGEIDEDWGVNEWCVGEGECGLGQIECASSSSTRCSVNPGGSDYDASAPIRREVCDGRDNDCDGEIDNGIYYIREDVAGICDNCINRYCRGEGDCQAGVFRCDLSDPNQMTVYCTGNDAGVEYEVCNSQDDDCDSEIDEVYKAPNNVCPVQVAVDGTDMVYLGCTCQGIGQCGTDYSGAVPIPKFGIGECDPEDMYSTICSTSPGGSQDRSTEEVCDGIDNDCDGEIDEDFHIYNEEWPCYATGQCGIQYVDGHALPRAGVWECDPYGSGEKICSTGIGGSEYNQVSGIEICDDIDNDCNGEVDDIPGLHVGQFCVGTGECRYLTGVLECKNFIETMCSVNPGGTEHLSFPSDPRREEICDGKDNDCDGEIDNGYETGSHCLGLGTCPDGILECDPNNPRATVCSTSPGGSQYYPDNEICDGIDNDCDGKTDEDFFTEGSENKCQACGTCGRDPDTNEAIFGSWECDPSDPLHLQIICSSSPGGSDYNSELPERIEVCDGYDNDCDCEIDEGCE